ncbi:alpha,alpha-trehalose-phosphate synthase [UDP-forming] 5-like, partial [Olea europaea subsp. europaea]
MVSKSYSNLLNLNSGDSTTFSRGGKKFSLVATIVGVLSELDDENRSTIGSDVPSSISQERMIIVGNQLPLPAHRRLDVEMGWDFSWDEDSLLLQLKDGLGMWNIKILPVGAYMGQLHSVLDLPETETKVAELQNKFKGWIILLGIDDMDIFKGISLKLLAFEQLLNQHPEKRDRDFGLRQAKELLDQLESVLANEPVFVKSGQHIVEVKP